MRSRLLLIAAFLTMPLGLGCGKSDEDAPGGAVADTAASATAAGDTSASLVLDSVELPAGFPADFPIAPAGTVVSATSETGEGGTFSDVTIASPGEPAATYAWYRAALTDAGWQVSSEGQTDEARTFHATQGESYVDLTVAPRPGEPRGWAQVDASIWKAGT